MAKSAYPLLQKAIKVAVKAHKKQDLDGDCPLPYVTHPIDVLNLVRYGAEVTEEGTLCGAVLHDLLEESDVTEKEIEKVFGKEILTLVKELTRDEPDEQTRQLPEDELWKIRNGMMMAEIDRMSDTAKLIKLADRCSNLAVSLKSKTGEKLDRYRAQSKMILEHIDREACPPLWDRIHDLLSVPEPAAKPKRKNIAENGATPVKGKVEKH